MTERELRKLVRTMQPELDPREWVFCVLDATRAHELNPIAAFDEDEGRTVVIERRVAETLGLEYRFPSRRITLHVYSDLEAIGFLATVTWALAKQRIPTNTFSAFHHDHLFVPIDRADEALAVLKELSSEAR